MKKVKKYLILNLLLLVFPQIIKASDLRSCGTLSNGGIAGFSAKIPELLSFFIIMAQVATTVILVILGSIDLFKGITSGKEEEMKKGQQLFIKRLIVGALVFFIVVIVKFLVGMVAKSNTTNILACMDCFINNKCNKYNGPNSVNNDNIYDSRETPSILDRNRQEVAEELKGESRGSSDNSGSNSSSGSTSSSSNIKSKTVFVGDSRTYAMCNKTEGYGLCENNEYIAKIGMGYDWFVNTAISNVNSKIKSSEYNIVILMGVNGVGTTASSGTSEAKKYHEKVLSLAKNSWKKQYIVFVSITPVNGTNAKKFGMSAEQAAVDAFNAIMKDSIVSDKLSNFKYCNIASELKMSEIDSGDGIHYTEGGYKKIYSLLKSKCLKK